MSTYPNAKYRGSEMQEIENQALKTSAKGDFLTNSADAGDPDGLSSAVGVFSVVSSLSFICGQEKLRY